MKPIRAAAVIGVVLSLSASSASAAHPAPSAIAVSATVEDGVVVGRADVTFGGDLTKAVGTDGTNDFADDADLGALAGPLGIDITELQIEIPASGGGVEFTIKVADLQAPPPGEIIRYLWQFRVDEVEYWVQAKSSDIATVVVADDVAGAATHLGGAFRLRGNCGPLGPLNNCEHLLWLNGEFDLENDEVRMRVPIGDPQAPQFVAGAEIAPDPEGVTASVQVVASNATTSDTAFQDDIYELPTEVQDWSVAFAIGPSGADPASLPYVLDLGPSFCGIAYHDGPWRSCGFTLEDGVAAPAEPAALFTRVCVEGNCLHGSGPIEI